MEKLIITAVPIPDANMDDVDLELQRFAENVIGSASDIYLHPVLLRTWVSTENRTFVLHAEIIHDGA